MLTMQEMTDEARKQWLAGLQMQERIASHKAARMFTTNTFKSVILINGGAAVALLALVSQVVKGVPGVVPAVMVALMWFAGGVLLGGLATFAYSKAQFRFSNAVITMPPLADAAHAHVQRFQRAASLLTLSGFVTFAIGVSWTAIALYRFNWPTCAASL